MSHNYIWTWYLKHSFNFEFSAIGDFGEDQHVLNACFDFLPICWWGLGGISTIPIPWVFLETRYTLPTQVTMYTVH